MKISKLSESLCFDGRQLRYRHFSESLQCDMHFSVFLPPQAKKHPVPVLYWLSGLTCTDENFVLKAGAQQYAARYGIALVVPDTSPRGQQVPDDPQGAWDFGHGAGFYLNATEKPWSDYYKMYDYITYELPVLVGLQFPLDLSRQAISGHSMGGHGALVIGLRNTQRYRSISAFAPICSVVHCSLGQKALKGYLGLDQKTWSLYDACSLIEHYTEAPLPIRIDQGGVDEYLVDQLKPELFIQACQVKHYPLAYHLWPGYGHGYFFIASFIQEHIRFHALHLEATPHAERYYAKTN